MAIPVVKTPETSQNESKEGKGGENMEVPELEHNRLGMNKHRGSDTETARQRTEVPTALHNDVDAKGKRAGEA